MVDTSRRGGFSSAMIRSRSSAGSGLLLHSILAARVLRLTWADGRPASALKGRRAGAASDYPGHRAGLSTQLLPISSVHAVASNLMAGTTKTLQLFSVYCWCAAQNSRTGHSRTARSLSAILTIRSCSGWAQKPFPSDHHLRAPRRRS